MLHHRTEDPAKRAESIAKVEAEKIWRLTNGDFGEYMRVFLETHTQVLKEFNGDENINLEEEVCQKL